MLGQLNAQKSMRMSEGEYCRLQALHLPWLRVPLAPSLLARPREPANIWHWNPGEYGEAGSRQESTHTNEGEVAGAAPAPALAEGTACVELAGGTK